jgi:hypothetical protein
MVRRGLIVAALLLAGCVPVYAQESVPELVTDRPDFTESSDVVGRGFVQFETGTTFEFDRSEKSMTAPLGLVRIGVGDRVEIRISGDGFVSTRAAHGISDMEAGVKVRLLHSEKWGFDAAVIPMITVPTGSREMSSGAYDPTLKLTYAKSLGRGFDLSGNVNFSRVTDGGDVYGQRAYSVSVGHDLGGHWGGYWEAYGFSQVEKGGRAAWTLDTGVSRGLGGNMQVDFEVGRGVTEAAPDWFVGVGFALRGRGFGRTR